MRIRSITPLHFGPFSKEQRIEFGNSPTVLTGANDVGKSSVLRLIAKLFKYGGMSSLTEDDVNADYLQLGKKPWDTDPAIGCRLTFEVTSTTSEYISYPAPLGTLMECECSIAPKSYSFVAQTAILPNGSHQHVGRQISKQPRVVWLPRDANETVGNAITLTGPTGTEKEFLNVAFGTDFHPASVDGMNAVTFKRMLLKANTNLNNALHRAAPSLRHLTFDLSDLHNNRKTLLVTVMDKHGGHVPARGRGSGCQKLISILGSLVATYEPSKQHIVILDEPENSLHADSQHNLRRALEGLATQANIQVVYSTHSPSMLNPINPAGIRLLTRDADGDRACTLVNNKPFGDNFFPIRASLGLSPSDSLLYAPVTIVVEGVTEAKCLGPLLIRLAREGVAGFAGVEQLLQLCHIVDGGGDSFELVCRFAKSQGAQPIIFVDGDKIRRVEQLRQANKLVGIPVVQLALNTEFEQLVPRQFYIQALSELLKTDAANELAFEDFLTKKGLPSKLLFSKCIDYWLRESFVDFVYEKAVVMERALAITPTPQLELTAIRQLVSEMKTAANGAGISLPA